MAPDPPSPPDPEDRVPVGCQVPRGLLVVGMHRSGTSALTGALQRLGVELGAQLIPAHVSNSRGHFEHVQAVWLHDLLLHELGMPVTGCRPMPEGWQASPRTAEVRRRLGHLVERDLLPHPLWALKDPRLCYLLPLWRDLAGRHGVGLSILHIVRPAEEVAASLTLRDGIGAGAGLLSWLRHNLEAERGGRGLPRATLSFGALLEDWRHQLGRVADQLGLVWPRSLEQAGEEVDTFLSRDLQHQHHAALEASPELLELTREYEAALLRSGTEGVPRALEDRVELALRDLSPAMEAEEEKLQQERRLQRRRLAAEARKRRGLGQRIARLRDKQLARLERWRWWWSLR